MRKIILIWLVFLTGIAYSQPRVLQGLHANGMPGKLIPDTIISLSVTSPLFAVNDSTIGSNATDSLILSNDSVYARKNGIWKFQYNMTIFTRQQDTITLASFGAGGGNAGDTAAFTTSSIYGSFFWDGSDTLVVTKSCVTLQGTSANIDYDIFFNDSLNVTAGASTILSSINITSTTTAYCTDEGFLTTKIPPGVWVWVKTSTVTTKPTYFSLSLIGYKKRVYL